MTQQNYNNNAPQDDLENGAMGWDDECDANADAGEFTVLKDGVYPFQVKTFERGRHDGSTNLPACNKAIIHLILDGGDQGTAYAKTNLFLHKKCQGFLVAFFKSIGAREDANGKIKMDWNTVPGARGFCKVAPRSWKGRDGEDRWDNDVKRFLPPDTQRQYSLAPPPITQQAPSYAPPSQMAPQYTAPPPAAPVVGSDDDEKDDLPF